MFGKFLKTGLISFLLLCSVSAALFGYSCSGAAHDDTPTIMTTCAQTFLEAPASPVQNADHGAVLVSFAHFLVSVFVALIVVVVPKLRYLDRAAYLERRDRLLWVWRRSGFYFENSLLALPFLSTHDA